MISKSSAERQTVWRLAPPGGQFWDGLAESRVEMMKMIRGDLVPITPNPLLMIKTATYSLDPGMRDVGPDRFVENHIAVEKDTKDLGGLEPRSWLTLICPA